MVRRDEVERGAALAAPNTTSRCASPAGESPVPVSVGAPGSRPRAGGEIRPSQAGCREPVRRQQPRSGEQERGPQHEVKPAASSHLQGESRAAHVTAKATSRAPGSGQIRARGLSGVEGAARVQGEERNTRDPSALPSSRQSAPYKPKAKSAAAQRESEGAVVPSITTTNNVAGGKGPCGGHVAGRGKREGMAGESGPNHPDRRPPVDKVRQL